ncbi:MAG TPA: cell wall-binding repeat-containing protein, partial [Acidimicrobiia bacterium]|nr:cell wall-binding repeat-containing protein [Acidimicrobiia bacterium]
LSGVSVSIPGAGSTTTNAGGGYSVPVSPNSTYQVSVSGAGVSASASAVVGTDNVGLDFIKGEVTAVPPGCVERWWGSNRYETAVAVSKATYPSGAEVVYVASGWNFPDALAAGAAAAAENAPILLVHKNLIPPETETELQRLGPSTVVILGGTAAIDQSVATQIGNLTGATIDRRWGPTRYETAAEISERAFAQGANTVFVATGTDFPDALAAAPGAVAAGSPLLLVPTTGIPPAVQVELVRLNPKKIEVIGSPSAIPDWLLGALAGYATQGADRTYGSDRYATSVEVSKMTFPNGANTVLIAVGAKFPDALAGGPATGVFPGPILLVQENAIPWVVSAELDRLGPDRIVVLGGPAAVSSLVASQLAIYLD